ncbi:MAG: pyridoxal phosphate-dependent aminotransferase [Polyangiaceae bacterium]
MSSAWHALPSMQYLPWAIEHMPLARLDLATSGVPRVPAEELGAVPHVSEWQALGIFAERVAQRYAVPAAEVVPALGAAGGISLLMQALAGPGDEVVVERPAYEPLLAAIEGRGAVARPFAREPELAWRVTREAVEAALGPRTRAVMLSNPHNPSGVAQSDEELRPIAEMLGARGIELVLDEVYRELAEPRSTARRLGDQVSVISSLTKCFGLGWARAGWVIARPEVAARLRLATLHMCGTLPATVGAYGAAGMAQADALLERGRRVIEANAERARELVAGSRWLRWTAPHPALPFGFVEHVDGRDLSGVAEALRAAGVLVVPGRFFGLPGGFRVSWMLGADALEEAFGEVERALDRQGGSRGGAGGAGGAQSGRAG